MSVIGLILGLILGTSISLWIISKATGTPVADIMDGLREVIHDATATREDDK